MTTTPVFITVVCFAFLALATVKCDVATPYYGVRIGKFSTHFHEVRGEVYAVDDKTIFIKGFNYDGRGPDAFFWAGSSIRPDASGFVVPDEKGTLEGLSSYNNQDVVLRLPVGHEVPELRWLSVWSKALNVNFGSLIFPKNLLPPKPIVIGPLENTSHGVSTGSITVLDTQTFLIPDFTYDGTGKQVFWLLSRGLKPNTGGVRLRDENGSELPLKQYSKKTVVISVPDGHSVFDYDSLSVWSDHDVRDYGLVRLPRDVLVPPSPRALGISLENKLNCEMLNDDLGFEIRWVINGDQLIMQLVAKIDSNEYMAFGLSSDDTETKFTSSDAIIAWLGPKGQGHVVDYFLMNTDKCDNGRGMCPDAVYEGASNSVTLMNTAKVNDYVMITFRRPLKADDKRYDQHVYTDGPQAVLWAVGTVAENGEIESPRLRTRGNLLMDFGREPMWNCPSPGNDVTMPLNSNGLVITEQSVPHVNCPTDLTFRAQVGPTNHPEDGSEKMWYVNGLPSPILTVQRGQVYTFLVEGGTTPPIHHPLYITSSKEGGLYQKVLERKDHEEIVFAGVTQDFATGGLLPTAEGRLCEWSSASMRGESASVTASSFDNGDLPLELSCRPGTAGKLEWLPDSNTSDIVYYQSFTGRNMGGIIRVVDWCEETDPEGYLIETGKKPGSHSGHNKELELERESESIETGEAQQPETAEVVSPFYGEFQQIQEQEIIPHDVQSDEEFRLPGEEIVEERIMNLQRGSQEKKKIDDFAKKLSKETAIDKLVSVESPNVRDEVETVAISRLKTIKNSEEPAIQRKVFVESHNVQNDAIKPHYRPLHLGDESPVSKPPPNFNVHFEGGFVPLIRNPVKENDGPEFLPPPFPSNQRAGSQKPFPFDANESVPFHGTFKPGVPDFSGFNISHYTQAPDSVPPNHAPEQYQGLHSVPNPHLLQRPLKPGIGHPQELFIRPQRPFTRPALVGYGPRPHLFQPPRQQHNPHVLAQLPLKHRPETFSSGSEDLDEGSSQRVQIALQNAGSKKTPQEEVPGVHNSDIKAYHGGLPVKLVAAAPPIQRRPDIVDGEDVEMYTSQGRPPYNNYQPNRRPNNDAPQGNVQYNLIPQMRPQRPAFPFRRPLPMNNRPPVNVGIFPPGMNVRPPQFINRPDGLGRPLPLSHPLRPNLLQPQSISGRPRPPPRTSEESVSEELKKFPPEKFSSIPSLEVPGGSYPQDEIVPLPPRENFGQPIKNRPQQIAATSPSKFPPQIFLQRPLNVNPDQQYHHNSNFNVPETASSVEKSRRPEQPVIIRDAAPQPDILSSLSGESEGDELDLEESQDSVLELTQQADYDSHEELEDNLENLPILPSESQDTDKEKSELEILLDHSLNPEHTFEDFVEVPSPFDATQGDIIFPIPESGDDSSPKKDENEINVIENETNEQSIHLPDEHLGEDILPSTGDAKKDEVLPFTNEAKKDEILPSTGDAKKDEILPSSDNIKYGERLQVPFQEPEKNQGTKVVTNRPVFFPVRRQPQFSSISTTEEPPTVTKDPIQRVKITASPTATPNINGWPGRKNILPSDGIDGHRMTEENIPSKRLEEIQLPQISQRPAAHDNGTDYSILTHVLSLIGGSPEPMDIIEPRTAT